VSYVPYRDHADTVQGFVALVVDVTERRELERQLRHSQKMEAVGRLAGGIAHDFNNLLMVITTSVSLARRSLARGGDVKPELDNVDTAATRAATLVRQLLAFSRRDDVRPQLLDLDTTIQQIRTMLARVIGEDVALSVSLQSRATVRADAGHLEQILMNLAVNARDAMPHGGVLSIESSRIELAEGERDLAAGTYARLTVTDTGIGMNSTTRARIFEPFFTTKELDKGSGLGLATVYGIVAQCRGAISVESDLGRGTRFDIFLPIATGDVAEVPVTPSVPTARGARILLVEDDESVRSVLRRALESEDYTVVEAASGADAVALVDRESFDLVITDMIMPQSTGRAVVEQIRVRRPGLPALFVSGYPEQHLAGLRLDSQSIDAYLAKPFRIDDVLATITRLLERARSAT
jgi:CheY-like chemotaxis protein/nitrogen-specific signal transduction histidine kinase